MNGEWSLVDLYPSYESQEYQKDWTTLNELLKTLEQIQLQDNLETIKTVINLLGEIEEVSGRLYAYSNLQLTTNTTDEKSLYHNNKLTELMSNSTKLLTAVHKFLGSIESDIESDEYLKHYTFFFKTAKENYKHLLSDEVEEVISMLNRSAGRSWETLQSYLTSVVETDLNDQKLTLSEIRNLAYVEDAAVRKQAFEAELAMYDQIKEPVAFALNNIKSQVNDIASLRGFDNALDEVLMKSSMSKNTLDALLSAIQDSLPAFRRYLKHKAKLLGHENGLPFYDLFAPIGEAKTQEFTVEESKDYLVKHFGKFSKDLADMTAEFYNNHYIDMFPRKGKVGGAFCYNLPFIKQSRILMNFDGSLRNVVTMAHELGHAYHGMYIENHLPLNRDYSMPVAETASTFNEALIMNSIIDESENDVKIQLIESELQDVTQIIVDIYSRYLFETSVFEARKENFLFAKDLEKLMIDAQLAAYGDGLDPNVLHPYMWVCKGHYYSADLSYYNFPYAFGGLFAKGLYAQYKQQPEGFVERYQNMLYATTVSTVEDTALTMGIDLTKKEFWQTALKQVEEHIDLFIKLTSAVN